MSTSQHNPINIGTGVPETHHSVMKVKKLADWAKIPVRADDGSVGFDVWLHGVSTTTQFQSETDVVRFRTGIAIDPPYQCYFLLVPRSSLSKTGWLMANSVGVIDPSFRGEIEVALYRTPGAPPLPLPGRYVQLVPMFFISPSFNVAEVKELSETKRGAGGFGSTGVA